MVLLFGIGDPGRKNGGIDRVETFQKFVRVAASCEPAALERGRGLEGTILARGIELGALAQVRDDSRLDSSPMSLRWQAS